MSPAVVTGIFSLLGILLAGVLGVWATARMAATNAKRAAADASMAAKKASDAHDILNSSNERRMMAIEEAAFARGVLHGLSLAKTGKETVHAGI
jgi:hypothetical protein